MLLIATALIATYELDEQIVLVRQDTNRFELCVCVRAAQCALVCRSVVVGGTISVRCALDSTSDTTTRRSRSVAQLTSGAD